MEKTIDILKQPKLCIEPVHILSHYTRKRFDIIKHIRFIYDISTTYLKAVVCLSLLPLVAGVCGEPLFSNFVLDAIYSSAINHLAEKES